MGVSRRRAIQVAAGAGIAAAVPGVQYASWSLTDRTREDFAKSPTTVSEGQRQWSNWSGIEVATPGQIAAPGSIDELADVLKTSEGRVRPVGSGHSFTGLVPSNGTIVDISKFAGIEEHDQASETAIMGAGTRLRHAARLLDEVGLGFHNLPDIDVQTLAGSFATGTHGTGAKLKALHDHAYGMTLVTPTGQVLDITRDKDPELFAAAKVSLGALGVITHYKLQLRENYSLRRRLWVEETQKIVERAEEGFAKHRNYEFFYVPNASLAADLSHDEYDGDVEGLPPEEDSNEMLDALKLFRDHLGWWPWLRQTVLEAAFPRGQVEDVNEIYWKMLATTRTLKFNEMEYHIPVENGFAAFREISQILGKNPSNYFPMEVRKTAHDDAWLSPFNDGDRISLAVHAAHSEDYSFFFTELEPVFRKYGGRPHWGKLHSLGYEELTDLYPRLRDFNEIRRSLDPEGKFLNSHLAKIFGEKFNA
ncbi:FAD-binding protein [Sneathiella sp. P13V-1]|uniref:D-arabinono-1,4-lactone oxidase n=1 Tax=Sneathiella sp. P13V-1 TaxID=2697366 RepID=UPI00187B9C76|nr:D-arabinono-1,4-lactone oxidase [Sneathiella sp. P13V-1]MBE7637763.1 FAD-binding protein [Sneathiella sp. P13V-1]